MSGNIEAPCPVVGCDGSVEFWPLGSDHWALDTDVCEDCGATIVASYTFDVAQLKTTTTTTTKEPQK